MPSQKVLERSARRLRHTLGLWLVTALVVGCATAYDLGADAGAEAASPDACVAAATCGTIPTPGQGAMGGAASPGLDAGFGAEAPPSPDPATPAAAGPPAQPESGAAGNPAATGDIPCEVSQVLESRCGPCHGAEPRFGAPQSLTTLDALRLWNSYVVDRITNVQRPMPPPPNAPLAGAELNTLLDWLRAGAPAGQACGGEDAPAADDGLVPEMPAPEADCDHLVDLTAHAGSTPDAPDGYQVPRRNDAYTCFAFTTPWQAAVHALSFHPIVDDDRVLHHWLLYTADSASTQIHGRARQNGEVYDCDGTNPGLALVAGWAPGGIPSVMPPDVGMEMPPPGGIFILEIHYHNDQGLDARDRSGVRICATETLRANTAAMHWLGEERGPAHILPFSVPPGDSEITGHCNPRISTPVNVIQSSPHMHRRGRRLRTLIHRASGGDEPLLDTPFDYQNQIIYPTPTVLYPGDRLSTTCFFHNDGPAARFGTSTDDEMCFNFVTAWPIGQLETGGSLVGAKHACLQ